MVKFISLVQDLGMGRVFFAECAPEFVKSSVKFSQNAIQNVGTPCALHQLCYTNKSPKPEIISEVYD